MPKLTKRFVESIEADASHILKIWDSELKGFGVIILPSGRKTYCIEYRNADRIKKRQKIGVHGAITTEEARNIAKIRLGKIANGQDLVGESNKLKKLPLFKDLADDYMERHAQKKRQKSIDEDKRLLEKYIIPHLQLQKVQNITRRDIEDLHIKMKKNPYQANRVLALLSKMFSLSVLWGMREDNPVKGIEKYQEEKRDRWLNDEEMDRLWAVLDQHSKHLTAYVFKFLLLTGARKGEALMATWEQIDLEKGLWTKPSHLTKQKKTEHLPLSEAALIVLRDVQTLTQKTTGHIFPGKNEGKPLQELKTFWRRVLLEAQLEKVRIHDLRHTHASHLVSSGLSLSIVGKLLGHTQAATTQRYAHLADAPLRQAADLFGRKVKGGALYPIKLKRWIFWE